MVPVTVRRRIQSFAAVVDIAAEIGIRIVRAQKGRAVVTGKTQAELARVNVARLPPVPYPGHYHGRQAVH